MIEPIAKHQLPCLHRAIADINAEVFGMDDHGEHCQCNGSFQKTIITIIPGLADHNGECIRWSPDCYYLFDYFYVMYEQREHKSPCRTHHHVWRHLNGIPDFRLNLQHYLIQHLNQTYSAGRQDTCACKDNRLTTKVSSTPASTTLMTSTTLKTSTVKTSPSTDLIFTTTLPRSSSDTATPLVTTKAFPACMKYEVISDVASSKYESNSDARQCPSGNKTSHEALVIANCNTGPTNTWTKGANVMSVCSSLPSYTPVASISSGNTGLNWDRSGIFISCLGNGFKIAYQDCDTTPTLAHIISGNGTGVRDPYNYFVILN
ncbi:uncharacterized protein LOC132756284 [Ruditapes philippinarum]|uniref:uncharacterized protein LOC132756284 n=1 Tax=Ruditapes philippinarum TaxID=129788 RepID=UPI00295B0206|nr:uncharacterized protein LOC132756284 [Ruditapes philippinarum]